MRGELVDALAQHLQTLQGVGDAAHQVGLLLLELPQNPHDVAVAALQVVADDGRVGGHLAVQPGTPPPDQREPVAAR